MVVLMWQATVMLIGQDPLRIGRYFFNVCGADLLILTSVVSLWIISEKSENPRISRWFLNVCSGNRVRGTFWNGLSYLPSYFHTSKSHIRKSLFCFCDQIQSKKNPLFVGVGGVCDKQLHVRYRIFSVM